MSVCTSRGAELCGFFTPCSPCACGDEVRAGLTLAAGLTLPPRTVVQRLLDDRRARVPDSARGDA